MPQLGETVTEGTITRWMKSVGDTVARDEPLFEVSTDKVDSEVPSPAAGTLTEILVPEGETVLVGARLAVIGADREAPAEGGAASPPADGPADSSAPIEAPEPAAEESAPVPPGPPTAASEAPSAPAPAPTPAEPAAPPPTDEATAAAQPPAPAPAPTPVAEPASDGAPPRAPAPGDAGSDPRLLSPVVRRLLAENEIDPAEVTGTGLGGRITREDVLALIDRQRAGQPAAAGPPSSGTSPSVTSPSVTPSAPPSAPAPAAPPPKPTPVGRSAPAAATHASATLRPDNERVVPFSNMRRRTAEHMVRSKATSAHAFIAYETDFENVERVRRRRGAAFKEEEGFSLTYLPFVARAAVEALRQFPNLNASVADNALVIHQQVNLGIAVDLNHEGLIVPVIHRAEEITLRGVARRIRDLADRARTRQLVTDDIAGGTFTITNDGPFGTYFTVPIINQPQVAILATDGIKRRPVVVEMPDGSESIAIHSTGLIGLSWDHRAVDGAYVSSYLALVAQLIAERDWSAEL